MAEKAKRAMQANKAGRSATDGRKRERTGRTFTKKLAFTLLAVAVFDFAIGAFAFWYLFLRPAAGFGHSAEVVVIPDASGLDESAARELFSAGDKTLYALSVRYEYADAPKGKVISQSPAAGSRRKASAGVRPCAVTLCVSLGKRTVTIPPLAGLSAKEAGEILSSLGLGAACQSFGSPSAPASDGVSGIVRESRPGAGAETEEGGTVVLLLDPPPKKETSGIVPTLVGLSEREARMKLMSAGFLVGEVTYLRTDGGFPTGGEAVVTSQQYVAGTRMRRGTKVGFSVEFSRLPAER